MVIDATGLREWASSASAAELEPLLEPFVTRGSEDARLRAGGERPARAVRYLPYPALTMLAWTALSVASEGYPATMAPS
jgi:hypothetical protein